MDTLDTLILRLAIEGGSCFVDLTVPGSDTHLRHIGAALSLDFAALQAVFLDPESYTDLLTRQLFNDADLLSLWAESTDAILSTQQRARVRILLPDTPEAAPLRSICWEALANPCTGRRLLLEERLILSRALYTPGGICAGHVNPIPLLNSAFSVVIAAANPPWLPKFGCQPIESLHEIDLVRSVVAEHHPMRCLDQIQTLGRTAGYSSASLREIGRALGAGGRVLYLVCHGLFSTDGEPALCLETETNDQCLTKGDEFCDHILSLEAPPVLIVLASCMSAGEPHYNQAREAIATRLAKAGIPAVLAMHGTVPVKVIHELMPRFFCNLLQHGLVDRALTAARRGLATGKDQWFPVLYSQIDHSCVWLGGANQPQETLQELTPLPLHHDIIARLEPRAQSLQALVQYKRVVIWGPSGIGTSALALDVALHYAQRDQIIWLDAASWGSVLSCVDKLARYLFRQGRPQLWLALEGTHAGHVVPSLKALLSKISNDLRALNLTICIDGWDALTSDNLSSVFLQALIESADTGAASVIVTSRPPLSQEWPHVEIRGMSRAEVDQLLTSRHYTFEERLREQLSTRTEGYPALLIPTIESLRDYPDPSQQLQRLLDAPDLQVALQKQPRLTDADRQLLYALAVLGEPVSLNAVRALWHDEGATWRLSELERLGLILKIEGGLQRLHRFWHEHFYEEAGHDRQLILHARATDYYIKNDAPYKVIYHAYYAEQYELAAIHAVSDGPRLIATGYAQRLITLLTNLQAHIVDTLRLAQIVSLRGEILLLAGQAKEAIDQLALAVGYASPATTSEERLAQARRLRLMARAAERLGQYIEGVSYCLHGGAVLTPADGASDERFMLGYQHATLLWRQGLLPQASMVCRQTLTTAVDLTDVRQAQIWVRMRGAMILADQMPPGSQFETIYNELQSCLHGSAQLNAQELVAALHVNLGGLAFDQGWMEIARRHYHAGVEVARTLGFAAAEIDCLNGLATIVQAIEAPTEAVAAYDELWQRIEQYGMVDAMFDVLLNRGIASFYNKDPIKAQADIARARNLAVELDRVGDRATCHCWLAEIALSEGNLNSAQAEAQEGLVLAEIGQTSLYEAMAHRIIAEVLARQDDPDRAEDALARARALLEHETTTYEWLGVLRAQVRIELSMSHFMIAADIAAEGAALSMQHNDNDYLRWFNDILSRYGS